MDSYIDMYQHHKALLRYNDNFNYYVTHEGKNNDQLVDFHSSLYSVDTRLHMMYEKAKVDKTIRTDSKVIATGVVGDLDPVTGDSEKIKLDSTEYKIDTSAEVYSFNKTDNPVNLIDLAKTHSGVQDAYSIKLIDNDGNGKIDRAVMLPFEVAAEIPPLHS